MEIKRIKVSFEDKRGKIIDILDKEDIDYVTLISSQKDAIRGNHYHKESMQIIFMLKGRMKIFAQMPGGKIETAIIKKGELAYNPPMEGHAFVALQDTEFMVFTRGPRGATAYETDTYRLSKSLI